MTKNHTPQTVATALRDLADVLDLMTPTAPPAPKVSTKVKKAPEGGYVVEVTAQKAPEGAMACVSCAKPMLRIGATCKTCIRAAAKGERIAPAAPKVAAGIAPEAKANMGRRTPDAHCSTDGCGLFVKVGASVCKKHTEEAVEQFITLDDGKRGYRVPAALVLSLRAAGLDDDLIIAAAQKKGLGYKVGRAKGSLV